VGYTYRPSRSVGSRLFTNSSAASIAGRIVPASKLPLSIARMNRRPSGVSGGSRSMIVPGASFDSRPTRLIDAWRMNSAEATRRSRPLIVTVKASGPIDATGTPSLSTTCTSTAMRSTPARNTGFCCAVGDAVAASASAPPSATAGIDDRRRNTRGGVGVGISGAFWRNDRPCGENFFTT
jgi:hypothetical protein